MLNIISALITLERNVRNKATNGKASYPDETLLALADAIQETIDEYTADE